MRRLLLWILPWLTLSCAVFAGWMHLAVLDPTRVAWLIDGNDHGQAAVGMAAYLRTEAPWPSLHSTLLMAPEGISLALTDGNPMLGLLLRPFAGVLPVGWQYVGWWLFACILLHTAFAAAMVRRFAPNPLAAWLGAALLTLMPVLLGRFVHVNLCAQWLILWALWIFLDAKRAGQPAWWVAVILAAMLIHPYILVMVAAIWASAMLRQAASTRGRKVWIRLGTDIAFVLAPLLIAPILLGTAGQPILNAGGYGGFQMALDALWNPNAAHYSALLPGRAPDLSQGFEGMNYLGAGLILLVLVALVHAVRHRAEMRQDDLFRRLVWLLPAFLTLTLLAIGPRLVWQGALIATIPTPDGLLDKLDPIRASGRMFWPVIYTLVFAAIVVTSRMRFGTWLLAGALLLQVVDLAPLFAFARHSSALAARAHPYRRTLDPRWDALIARADMIEFQPAEPYRDLALMEEVTWRAIVAGKPVRYFYASREPTAVRRRLIIDAANFNLGQADPRRLYVLLDGKVPPLLAGRETRIDGATIIAPRPR